MLFVLFLLKYAAKIGQYEVVGNMKKGSKLMKIRHPLVNLDFLVVFNDKMWGECVYAIRLFQIDIKHTSIYSFTSSAALLLVTMNTPVNTSAIANPLRGPKTSTPIIEAAMVATIG